MSNASPLLVSLALGLAFLASARSVRADLAPPDDQKYVGYSFSVTGLSKAPDRVVFAFPCGTSSGAPIAEQTLVKDGYPVSVGRRGGECKLYSTTKTAYDEWIKTYTPSGSFQDPKVEAFLKTTTECKGKPTPTFVIPKTDTRSSIEEVLEVVTLTADACVVRSKSATPSTASAASTPPAVKKGCSVGGAPADVFPWLLALGVPALLRRRRARSDGA